MSKGWNRSNTLVAGAGIKLRAVVLAAGRGTRISACANNLPKPLLPIQGEPILRRNLRWLASQGINECWINLHYRPEAIITAIGDGRSLGMTLTYMHEPDLLGTAGGVRNIAAQWNEPVLVVYGDNLLSFELKPMIDDHRESGALVTIACFDPESSPHTGIAGGSLVMGVEGYVSRFQEAGPFAEHALVNAGVYLCEGQAVAAIQVGFSDFGNDLFPALLRTRALIGGYRIKGYCLGIDTPQAYARAVELVSNKVAAIE